LLEAPRPGSHPKTCFRFLRLFGLRLQVLRPCAGQLDFQALVASGVLGRGIFQSPAAAFWQGGLVGSFPRVRVDPSFLPQGRGRSFAGFAGAEGRASKRGGGDLWGSNRCPGRAFGPAWLGGYCPSRSWSSFGPARHCMGQGKPGGGWVFSARLAGEWGPWLGLDFFRAFTFGRPGLFIPAVDSSNFRGPWGKAFGPGGRVLG